MASKVYKQHALTIDIGASSRTNIITNTTFFTMDIKSGKKVINFTLNGERFDLTDATVMLGFEFVDKEMTKIIDSKDGSIIIERPRRGECSVVLPNHLYQYSGQVLVHAYIMFDDGRSFDAGIIVTEFKESWLDSELKEMTDFYVKRFEDLAEEIRLREEEIKAEMNKELEVVKQNLASAQGDIDYIQEQINTNGLIKRNEFDTAGFGENNLIRNATEPIIINPAGDATNAFTQVCNGQLKQGVTYSIGFHARWLRGSATYFNIHLLRRPAVGGGNEDTAFIRRIELSGSDETYCTADLPIPVDQNLSYRLVVYAGAFRATQGNTLKLTNRMLTVGTKPQPYLPAHEDNTERLDAVETLKPNIKRTVATFEGKVMGSVVENPHEAHRLQSTRTLSVPSSTSMTVFTQGNYDNVRFVGSGNVTTISSGNPDALAQHRFTFNIIEHLERNYSTSIWQGHTALSDKVRIAKQIVKRIACVWDGRGETNGVPLVTLRRAESLTNWIGGITHQNTIPQRISMTVTPGAALQATILSDGTCRYLVHTAEGQTTPIGGATLATAFVQFEVDVETTLAYTDWSYSKAEIDALKPTTAPLPLATTPQMGTSGRYADANHVHQMPTASQVGALPLSGGRVTGRVTLEQDYIVHQGGGVAGTAGWIRIARLRVTSGYQNAPIEFGIARRSDNRINYVTVRFTNNIDAVNTTLQSFSYRGVANFEAHIHRVSDTSVDWDLIVRKTESHDRTYIVSTKRGNDSTPTITWMNGMVTTLPTGTTRAVAEIINADTATRLQTARNITIGNATKSFNGTANVSWSLGDIGAAPKLHTHSTLQVQEQNPNLNNYKDEGDYYFDQNNIGAIVNRPQNSVSGWLNVTKGLADRNGNVLISQKWQRGTNSPAVVAETWTRFYHQATDQWSQWVPIAMFPWALGAHIGVHQSGRTVHQFGTISLAGGANVIRSQTINFNTAAPFGATPNIQVSFVSTNPRTTVVSLSHESATSFQINVVVTSTSSVSVRWFAAGATTPTMV